MGLLDGSLSRSIYGAFRGKLLKGAIRRLDPSGTTDGLGDPVAVQPRLVTFEGFTEAFSAFTRAQAGIPATDLKLNIFAASAPGFTPMANDQGWLSVGVGPRAIRTWYQIRGPIDLDPAGVLWVCQAFVIPEPA